MTTSEHAKRSVWALHRSNIASPPKPPVDDVMCEVVGRMIANVTSSMRRAQQALESTLQMPALDFPIPHFDLPKERRALVVDTSGPPFDVFALGMVHSPVLASCTSLEAAFAAERLLK